MPAFMSVQAKAAMKVSLPVLQSEYGFRKMYVWGKLKGMSADYIIAQGVTHSLKEDGKKFFYCLDGASWAQMIEPEPAVVEACKMIPATAMLTGDAAFQYTVTHEVPEGEEPPENPEDLTVTITEDVRAACMVKEIDAAIAMVPVGAIIQDPTLGVPMANSTFAGLSKQESLDLKSWELLAGLSASQQLAGSLKSKHMPAHSLTVLRSLSWPGFCAFCVPSTDKWGYIYVGDGQKNSDIAFSLP